MLFGILFFALSLQLFQSAEFSIQVKGIKKSQGFIMLEIKDEKGKVLKQVKQDVKVNGTTLSISDLPAGSYAIAVFHDANSDGKLNTNLVGIPSEAYGFSNDARGTFGPPGLADQLVTITAGKPVVINIK